MAQVRGKERFKAHEARRALLDAGRELLIERGVAPGLDRVTLKDAITKSGVPRTTAYRVFGETDSPLQDFRDALLADLEFTGGADDTVNLVFGLIERNQAMFDNPDPIGLATLLREMGRIVFAARSESIAARPEWPAYMSSIAAVATEAEPRRVAVMHDAVEEAKVRFVPLLEASVGQLFGLRPRPPLSWIDLTAILIPIEDGIALRSHIDPFVQSIKRPTGPDGAMQAWHAAAVAFEGVLLTMCEPDPQAAVSADLSSWLSSDGL